MASLGGLLGVVLVTVVLIGPVLKYFGHPGIAYLLYILIGGGVFVAFTVVMAERFGESTLVPLKVFCVAANFTFVGLTFTMFRAASLEKAGSMYERLVTMTTYTPNLHRNVVAIVLFALILQWTPRKAYDWARERFIVAPAPLQAAVLFAVAIALKEAASADAVPFVYFQF